MADSNPHQQILRCGIRGIGAWGRGYDNWADLSAMLRGGPIANSEQAAGPKPQVIPANERRRAPLLVRLAVESSWQAVQQSALDPKSVLCVFSSTYGDIDITDYMCRALTTETKALSPTKFHNSVHNAPAGYWTISTGCMQSANSVAGYDVTATVTLLEGMIQCVANQQPVLVTLCDPPVESILQPILLNRFPFSASLVIVPEAADGDTILTAKVDPESAEWPSIDCQSLEEQYLDSPAAKILGLLKLLANNDTTTMTMPLSAATSLALTVSS